MCTIHLQGKLAFFFFLMEYNFYLNDWEKKDAYSDWKFGRQFGENKPDEGMTSRTVNKSIWVNNEFQDFK